MSALILVLLAYGLGATPTSYWVGRGIYRQDLRVLGSGNLGATNTFRVLGWKAAVPVLAADVAKGWFPVWWFPQIDDRTGPAWVVAYGAAAILGHVFSFWVGFKGGKGVATSSGVLLGVWPPAVLAGLGAWLAVLATTRMVSAGSIAAAVVVPLTSYAFPSVNWTYRVFFSVIGVFVIWAHRGNIRRILAGSEARIGASRPRVDP